MKKILCNVENTINSFPITQGHVRKETLKDCTLKSVLTYLRCGTWLKPSRLNGELTQFNGKKTHYV